MKKYYEDAKYDVAFTRCVDVMTKLVERYGVQILEKMDSDCQNSPQKTENVSVPELSGLIVA